jgi:VWFA-related protein
VNALGRGRTLVCASAAAVAIFVAAPSGQERPTGQGFSFKTGVDLVNVSVTVTDANGRFVSGLKKDDFIVYEDGKPQEVAQFDSERVPVSLGIALDTSGSMLGEKIVAAQAALNRFLFDLLGPQDEVFLYRFDGRPELVQSWTKDRRAVSQALGSVKPMGGTALYDTVSQAIPLAQGGSNKKKALVLISDGNDTSSHMRVPELQQIIRESEVLVYAIGIDASDNGNYSARQSQPSPRPSSPAPPTSVPVPAPFPGAPVQPSHPKPAPSPTPAPSSSSSSRHSNSSSSVDRVNPAALRAITDDSGGRTEIIVSPKDLDPTTAGIADELSRQYFLGYASSIPKDGKWHTIEVRLRKGNYLVRARKGFVAS